MDSSGDDVAYMEFPFRVQLEYQMHCSFAK